MYDDTLHVQCSLWFIRRFHTAQIWVCVKRTFKLLGIDFAVFIENVRIYLCDHIGLRMPCVALCGFDVAVIKFQLISRAGMPLRYNYDKPEKPRRIKGFEVFSLVFSSFSKPKNHTEISRIIGGVSLTTNE